MKHDRRLSLIGALVAASATAGCSAYRPVAPLDEDERAELTALRTTLQGRTIAVVAGPRASAEAAVRLADVLRELGVAVGPGVDGSAPLQVAFDGPDRPMESIARMEGNIFFFLVTLGLWPQSSSAQEVWTFRVADGAGRESTIVSETTRPHVFGWIAGPLATLPGWSFGGPGERFAPETDAERDNRRTRAVLDIARALAAAAAPN